VSTRPIPRTAPHTLKSWTQIPAVATLTTCPVCGRELVRPGVRTDDPDTAPWLCNEDRHGFWNAELSGPARRVFRPSSRDWGFTAAWLRIAVDTERGLQ
jgi:hypothetical protein